MTTIGRFKAVSAAGVSLLLVSAGPAQTAFAAQIAAAAARGATGVRVAPAPIGAMGMIGAGSLTGAQAVSPALLSALPALPSLAPAVLPNSALTSPGISVLTNAPLPSLEAVRRAPEAKASGINTAPAALGTSKKTVEMSRQVRTAVESLGPVSNASAGGAHSLGRGVIDIITGRARSRAGSIAVAPQAFGPRTPMLKRAGISEDGANETPRHDARSQEITKREMVRTLDTVAGVFSANYGPLDWKNEKFKVELRKELAKAKRAVEGAPFITTRQFQNIVAGFVYALKDYHVGIQFYSTEMAMLPLNIASAGGKYFITFVNREVLPEEIFPFQPGDQVVEFDGKPVAEVVAELKRSKGSNTAETDAALAEMKLTQRVRQAGDDVPNGTAKLKILTRAGELKTVRMPWARMDEMIPEDVPVRDGGHLLEGANPFAEEDLGEIPGSGEQNMFQRFRTAVKNLVPTVLNPIAGLFSKLFGEGSANPFQIGGRDSFVPDLGELIWEAPPMLPFKAYIYKNEEGKKVGYLRIPSYMGNTMAAEMFGQIIEKFEAETDALVLDQVNNPGGSVFFVYGLISRLISKPAALPKHRTIIGESDAMEAAQALRMDSMINNDFDAMRALGQSLAGYPVTLKVWKQFASYFRYVMSELRAGRRLTEPVAMMGIDEIEPHPTQRYTKPITVLINELDFSGADFLPAILQDAGRATLFGVRTAGAGGAVRAMQIPNQFGIAMIAYTWTLAIRPNGKPIENLGVQPDRKYKLSERDMTDNFSGYKDALNKHVSGEVKAYEKANPKPVEETKPEEDAGRTDGTPDQTGENLGAGGSETGPAPTPGDGTPPASGN